MNLSYVLPVDMPRGEWPDAIHVVHAPSGRDGDSEPERAMVYVPERRGRRVVIGNMSTDFATGSSRCAECGGSIDYFDRFCRHCGTELED